jgi:hypothetical protein
MASVKNSIMFTTGGGTNITVVANYSALPDPTTVSGQFYWCESSQGTAWLPGGLGGTYYNSGMYYSNGVSWNFMNVPYQATQSEVNTGTNTDKFVTPSTLKNSTQFQYLDATSSIQGQIDSKEQKASFMCLSAPYVGTSGTALQKIFNVGSGGNGAFNALANKTYEFVCEFDLTNMASGGVSSTFSFGFLGSAGVSSIKWTSLAAKGALATASTSQITSATVGTATVITNSSTSTTGKACVTGVIRTTGAGTIIPAFAVSVSATPQVEANSIFIIRELGSDTVTASSDIS